MGYFWQKKEEEIEEDSYQVGLSSEVEDISLPELSETRADEWVDFGENNLFPKELQSLYITSPMNQAIINRKALMMSGSGIEFEQKDLMNPDFVKLIELPDGKHDLESLLKKWSLDSQTYGSYAIEVMMSKDFSKITKFKYVDTSNIRSGWMVNGEVRDYYYSEDWNNISKFAPTRIGAFDVNNKSDYNQLIYVTRETIGLKYYGMPSWYSAKNSILLNTGLTTNYLADLNNGFSPKIALKFKQTPKTEQEKDDIVKGVNKSYTGKTGKRIMTIFSKNADLTPDIETLNNNQVSEQWLAVSENSTQNILTAHGVTSPELFGVAISGKLGNAELEESYNIFFNTIVRPEQLTLQSTINKIFKFNELPTIKIKQSQVLEVESEDGSSIDKEKSYNGAQITSAVTIMQNVNEGILTEQQAIQFMIQMLGFEEEQAFGLFGKTKE